MVSKRKYIKPQCTVIAVGGGGEGLLAISPHVSAVDWKQGEDEDLSGDETEISFSKVNVWMDEEW